MDYPTQRQKYLSVFPNYLNDLELTFQLKNWVRRLNPTLWNEVENLSDTAIKCYILLELTKTQESCTEVIQLLRGSKVRQNIVIAEGLQVFNTSSNRNTFGGEIEFPVTPVLSTEGKWPNTLSYSMTKYRLFFYFSLNEQNLCDFNHGLNFDVGRSQISVYTWGSNEFGDYKVPSEIEIEKGHNIESVCCAKLLQIPVMKLENKNFEYQSNIGTGGFGTVNKYKTNFNKKYYAIKIIYIPEAKKYSQDFLREVNVMNKINSDFVVQYHNSWIENDFLFIQMELCSENLRQILENKPIVFERNANQALNSIEYFISCEIFRQITEALNYLHSIKPNPVIHRDLNPGNILIGMSGHKRICKLADFGLSKFIEDHSDYHSQGIGTIGYIAPEVNSSSTKYGTQADVYSLGIVGLEIFALKSKSNQKVNDLYKSSLFGVKIGDLLKTIQFKLAFITKDERLSAKELLELLPSLTINWEIMIDSMSICDRNYDYFLAKCKKESDFFYGILKQ